MPPVITPYSSLTVVFLLLFKQIPHSDVPSLTMASKPGPAICFLGTSVRILLPLQALPRSDFTFCLIIIPVLDLLSNCPQTFPKYFP